MEKGHYGKYTGNARCCMDHADTKVTASNYKATEKDDAAHIDYLKRDILYDNHHGHSDEKMTADEKHISKLAGDMKYDKKHHGSPTHMDLPRGTAQNIASAASNVNPMREAAKLASEVNELKFKDDAFAQGIAGKKREKGKAIYGALTKEGKDIANEYLTGKRKITN
jgi:hypothetical protein